MRVILLAVVPLAAAITLVAAVGVCRTMLAPVVAIDGVTARIDDAFRSHDLIDAHLLAYLGTVLIGLLGPYARADHLVWLALTWPTALMLTSLARGSGRARARRAFA